MPVLRAAKLAVLLGAALALTPVSLAWACTQEEYMTEEQRASGLYDNTPPEYAQDWGGAPHTHGEEPAPGASEPAADAAPATKPAATKQVATKRPLIERAERERPAPKPARAPEPVGPVATTAPATAPPATAPAPVDPAPVARAPRVRERPASPQRAERRQGRAETTRPSRRPAPERVAPAPVSAPHLAAAARDGTIVAPLALLAFGVALAAAVVLRRRPRPDAAATGDSLPRDPDAEAELQEIISEAHARTVARERL